jgi:hypothetical protein
MDGSMLMALRAGKPVKPKEYGCSRAYAVASARFISKKYGSKGVSYLNWACPDYSIQVHITIGNTK